jgi:hypothetical protein
VWWPFANLVRSRGVSALHLRPHPTARTSQRYHPITRAVGQPNPVMLVIECFADMKLITRHRAVGIAISTCSQPKMSRTIILEWVGLHGTWSRCPALSFDNLPYLVCLGLQGRDVGSGFLTVELDGNISLHCQSRHPKLPVLPKVPKLLRRASKPGSRPCMQLTL